MADDQNVAALLKAARSRLPNARPATRGESDLPRLLPDAGGAHYISGAPMRRLAALLAVLIVTACTNEIDQSTRPESVVGSYQLRAYGGRKPPVEVSTEADGTMLLLSGELVIGADKSFTETRTYRYIENGATLEVSFGSAGSWVFLREGADMQFNDKVLGYQFTGTAAGGSVTLSLSDGSTVIYSR